MQSIQKQTLGAGVVLGAIYGLACFFGFQQVNALPTAAFVFLVPIGIGALSLFFTDPDQLKNFRAVLFIPWMSVLLMLFGLVAFFHEGAICLLVLGFPLFGGVLLGSFIFWLVRAVGINTRKKRAAAAIVISILPLIFLPLEQRHGLPAATYQVQSSTVIAGTPEEIWSQLAEVDTIQPGEYPSGLFHFLGVPRPIRATVDRAEVGGHRTGEFEYGLRFDERITVYDAPETMSFSIAVDPRTLRENSSERHAFEGHYFRFEDATYHLVLVDDTHLRLELSSRYTVKSGANWYAQLWADAVFGDFQDRVLAMLKGRIEKGTRMASSP